MEAEAKFVERAKGGGEGDARGGRKDKPMQRERKRHMTIVTRRIKAESESKLIRPRATLHATWMEPINMRS